MTLPGLSNSLNNQRNSLIKFTALRKDALVVLFKQACPWFLEMNQLVIFIIVTKASLIRPELHVVEKRYQNSFSKNTTTNRELKWLTCLRMHRCCLLGSRSSEPTPLSREKRTPRLAVSQGPFFDLKANIQKLFTIRPIKCTVRACVWSKTTLGQIPPT